MCESQRWLLVLRSDSAVRVAHGEIIRTEVTGRTGRAWSALVARLAASCGSFRPKTLKQGEHDGIDG